MPPSPEKPVIKVVVCGDRFVGKTSIISTWTNSKKYGQFIEKRRVPQNNTDITRMEVKNEYYVDFYDVIGWEEPSSNCNVLSENTNFVLIVYDTTNSQSWISATTVWLEWFEKFSPNVNIMLLGTKNDAQRRVSSIKDCENFCKSFILKREEKGNYGVGNGLFFMEVSPKIGTNMDLTLSILLIRISHLVSILKENVENSLIHIPITVPNRPTDQVNYVNQSISTTPFQNPSTNTENLVPSSRAHLYNTTIYHEDISQIQPRKKVSSSSQTSSELPKSKPSQTEAIISNDFETGDIFGINASGFITLPPVEIPEEQRISITKNTFSKKIQNYQETKEGFVIPVIETDLYPNPQKINYFRPVTTAYDANGAKLILSINLGEGRICKVGVVSGDNIFHLADLVVKQHQVDPKLRQEIAFNVRNSINKYIEKQQGLSDNFKKHNNPRIREAEQFNQTAHSLFQNSTSFQPFNFASDHLQTRPVRPPILQLKITISKGKSGVIVVREGDDITELAKNFINTFGLKREQLPKIVDKITKHLEVEQEELQQEEEIFLPQKPKPTERDVNTEPKKKILFNLDVEISEGNSKILTIKEGDIATNVAKEFSKKFGIGDNAEVMLVQLIQYHMKNYLDQNNKK